MRSESEIAKYCYQAITFIITCKKGCADKPPGLYCPMCDTLNRQIKTLEWVREERDSPA